MRFAIHQRSLRITLLAVLPATLLAAGVLFMNVVRDANAQDHHNPGADSIQLNTKTLDADESRACLNDIRKACDRLSQYPDGDSVLRYTCRVETAMVDTTIPNSVADVHVAISKTALHAVSDHFELYRDSISVFTVIPSARTIYRSDALVAPKKDMFGNLLDRESMRDSILKKARILDCSTTADSEGRSVQTIRLSPDPDVRRDLNTAEITVVIDRDLMLPIQMSVKPMRPELFASVTWDFSNVRIESTGADFPRHVAELFEGRNGMLTTRLHGYHLVDTRCEALAAIVEP